ncbi:hypothetical protein B0H34DRAFT_694466 [Crassisporium funariophilum]|nr:hypothetical protein B0H34DRAFT_694466 [Crassisporium funariophilum]
MDWFYILVAAFAEELTSETYCPEALLHDENVARGEIRAAALGMMAGDCGGGHDQELLGLMDVFHENMSVAGSGPALHTWRKFYTDVCILRAFEQVKKSQPLLAISNLDRAIIIAGPCGEGRLELIHTIIHHVQIPLSPTRFPKPALSFNLGFVPLTCTVPCLSSAPSFLSFQSQHSRRPFILRNFASDWPAMSIRPWKSAHYLRSVAGPGRLVPVEVGEDYRTANWKQELVDWDDFLTTLDFEDQPSPVTSEPLYLAQHDLTKQFPALRDDIIVPDYIYASLSCADYPEYQPPRNADQVLFNTWLGPRHTMSPAHTDPYHNLYVQVVGYKSVWLAPPSVSASMYPYPSEGSDCGAKPLSMGNTSQLDVFSNNKDSRYTGFWNQVVPESMTATLGPGDVIFFPPGWWHAMRSETTSFSFSMWF